MEQITRDGDIITIKSEVTKTIDLGALRAELATLESMEEPSDEELIDFAKRGETHPFYTYNPDRIRDIKAELEKWQSLE